MCARALCVHAVPRPYVLKLSTEFLSDCSIVAHSRLANVSETSLVGERKWRECFLWNSESPACTNYDTTEIFGVTCTGISPQKFLRTPTWIPPTTSKTFDCQARLALNFHFVFNRDFHQRGGCAVSLEEEHPFIAFLSQFSDQFHGFDVDRALSVSSRTRVTASASTKWKKLAWNSRYTVNGSVFERRHRFLRLITRPRLLSSGSQRSTTETARFKRYRGGLITRERFPHESGSHRWPPELFIRYVIESSTDADPQSIDNSISRYTFENR